MSQWARANPERMAEIAALPVSEQQDALRSAMGGLAGAAGIPLDRCEVCDGPLADEPWKRGLDGAGAHLRCLRAMGVKV